jgi:hypothetical protein
MTFWQAIASLLVPAHFSDWYVADAAQGTHLIFGVLAFGIIAWCDEALSLKHGGDPMPVHLVMIAAMCAVASWEVASLVIYGGSVLDRVTNIAFMTAGSALAWAIWTHRWRLMGWSVLSAIVALAINAAERL